MSLDVRDDWRAVVVSITRCWRCTNKEGLVWPSLTPEKHFSLEWKWQWQWWALSFPGCAWRCLNWESTDKCGPQERVFLFPMWALFVIPILELNYIQPVPCLLGQPDEHHDINDISYDSRGQTCSSFLKFIPGLQGLWLLKRELLIITQDDKALTFIECCLCARCVLGTLCELPC